MNTWELILLGGVIGLVSTMVQVAFQYKYNKNLEKDKKEQEYLSSLKEKKIQNYTEFLLAVVDYISAKEKNFISLKKPFCNLLLSLDSKEKVDTVSKFVRSLKSSNINNAAFEEILKLIANEIHGKDIHSFTGILSILQDIQKNEDLRIFHSVIEENIFSLLSSNKGLLQITSITNTTQKKDILDLIIELINGKRIGVDIKSSHFQRGNKVSEWNKDNDIKAKYSVDGFILITEKDSLEEIKSKLSKYL